MTTTNALILIVIAAAIAYHCGKRNGFKEGKLDGSRVTASAMGPTLFGDGMMQTLNPAPSLAVTVTADRSQLINAQPMELEKL